MEICDRYEVSKMADQAVKYAFLAIKCIELSKWLCQKCISLQQKLARSCIPMMAIHGY